MRKLILVFIMGSLCTVLRAQFSLCDMELPMKTFSGAAPSPWQINGQVNDWHTILGGFSGNNALPFTPAPSSNWANENLGSDADNPPPALDITFMAYTQDDYNAYFYFRRAALSEDPSSFYYFLDVNADGFMNSGEPVVGSDFKGKKEGELTLYKYIANTAIDYDAAKGNWMVKPSTFDSDGYSLAGSTEILFTEKTIPAHLKLLPHEVFRMKMTENGYGMELSVPFRYLRNWLGNQPPLTSDLLFTYHLSLQSGSGPYAPASVRDNGGNCCGKTMVSGVARLQVLSTTIELLSAPNTYRVTTTFQNPLNVSEAFHLQQVSLKNIVVRPGLSFDPEDIVITAPGLTPFSYVYSSGDASSQPVVYKPDGFIGATTSALPGQVTGFIVDISFPSNGAISQVFIELEIGMRLGDFLQTIYCFSLSGGGKGINPVGVQAELPGEVPPAVAQPEDELILEKTELKMSVFPNPSRDKLTISIPLRHSSGKLYIRDISGKAIRELSVSGGERVVLSGLKPGFYIASLETTAGVTSVKFVVQ